MRNYRREVWLVEVVEDGRWQPAPRECYERSGGREDAKRSSAGLRANGTRARVRLYIAQDERRWRKPLRAAATSGVRTLEKLQRMTAAKNKALENLSTAADVIQALGGDPSGYRKLIAELEDVK